MSIGTAQFINGDLICFKTIKILIVAMKAERCTVNAFLVQIVLHLHCL